MLLAKEIIKGIPEDFPQIPEFGSYFQFENSTSPLLIKGKLGFQNGNSSWERFLEGFEKYTCIYQKGICEGEKIEMFRIEFSDKDDSEKFIKQKGWTTASDFQNTDKTEYFRQEGNTIIYAKGKIRSASLKPAE